jgi:hypothetical protein
MPKRICRLTKNHPWRPEIALNDVVRHKPVASHDKFKSALALSDAALSDEKYANLKDVDKNAMKTGSRRESLI